MRATICVAAGVIAALTAPATAGAKVKVHSFEGSCAVQGTVHFSPPATNDQQSLSVRYAATGTCTGTLDGRALSDEPVRAYNAADRVDGSCMHADTTEPGRAAIVFPDGTTIVASSEFHFVATEGEFILHGERSGSARGHGTFLTQRTPPDIALQCAGDGASEAPLDISFATDSPLVSRHRGGKRPARRWR